MIFSTYEFILIFLPIVFITYFFLNKFKMYTISKIWLVISSLYFYAQGSSAFFPFFLGSIFGNYCIGTALTKLQAKGDKKQLKLLPIKNLF